MPSIIFFQKWLLFCAFRLNLYRKAFLYDCPYSFSFPACSFFKELESVLKNNSGHDNMTSNERPNKTLRNFRGIWQVELLQYGRLSWQFSKMLSEGKLSSIQGFQLRENCPFCCTLNLAHLCFQYMVLNPKWQLGRGVPEWVIPAVGEK